MFYIPRNRWPVALGVAISAAIVGVELSSNGPEGLSADWRVWELVAEVMLGAVLVQMLVNRRAALGRERRLVRTAAQLRETSAELDRLARTDPLTGVPNRRSFYEQFGVEFRRSQRYGRQFAALMVDLDHFKRINDRWGHHFGDYVLQQTAKALASNVRESDLIGRYGGEEFVLALPETDAAHALLVAEKLRAAVAALEFRLDGVPPEDQPAETVTISVGVASLPVSDGEDENALIRRADQALYEAKRTGRNRVTVFSKDTRILEGERSI